MSIGEDRVRVSFNPGGNDLVNIIKARAANLIDKCEEMRDGTSPSEKSRLISLAQTAFEEGAMWAVKAATAGALAFFLGWLAWTFPAFAADLQLKAAPLSGYGIASWQGLYLSAYGLYGANLTNTTVTDSGGISADLASAPHGPGIGGSVGYYFQPTPNGVVFGPRVDLAYANMQGGGNLANALSVSNATNYLGDVDLIVGLPLSHDGRFMGYVGGGFAFGGGKPNLQVVNLQQAAADTSTGWNAVAGLAYQIAPNWQLFMEGNYYQLGDKSLSVMDGETLLATSNTKFHIFTQKFGASFKF
jgi:opacity protein-like surface antigen